jgi:hypothetical protein
MWCNIILLNGLIFFNFFHILQVEKALNNVAKKSSETNNAKAGLQTNENKKDSNQTKNQNPSLKGVSQSLIDKVCLNQQVQIFS